jgi:hypothetical protein
MDRIRAFSTVYIGVIRVQLCRTHAVYDTIKVLAQANIARNFVRSPTPGGEGGEVSRVDILL